MRARSGSSIYYDFTLARYRTVRNTSFPKIFYPVTLSTPKLPTACKRHPLYKCAIPMESWSAITAWPHVSGTKRMSPLCWVHS